MPGAGRLFCVVADEVREERELSLMLRSPPFVALEGTDSGSGWGESYKNCEASTFQSMSEFT